MNNPGADTPTFLPRRQDLRQPAENRAFIITAVAATHDLLVMNHRPDLAPEFNPPRTAVRARQSAP
jgi:hypothetical protein